MLTRCLTSCCCPVANEEVDHPSESLLSNMQPQTPMTIATELPSRDTSSTRADAPNAIALTTATPLTREQEAELPPLVFASPAPAPTGSSEVVLDELVMRSAPPSDPKAIPQMQPRSAASSSADDGLRKPDGGRHANRRPSDEASSEEEEEPEPERTTVSSSFDSMATPSQSSSLPRADSSPVVGSLEMYNALLGGRSALETALDKGKYEGELNTETCPICCEEMVLGPQEAVTQMCLPAGELPRHFECGHALHSDCFAMYVMSSGHTCPICALEGGPPRTQQEEEDDEDVSSGWEEEGEEDDAAYVQRLEERRRSARRQQREREQQQQQQGVGGGVGGFNVEAVLDALNLAGARTSDAEDYDEEEEAERREAAREELELQEALRMSIRESQTDGS